MTDRSTWIADNRANWDDRAAAHEASGYGIPERVADHHHIGRIVGQDRERLGALDGLDVVHLQCHLGTDTVDLWRLGARRVVGLDFSGESIRRARDIASRCGAGVEHVQADVFAAREAIAGDFDLVYTSVGVLCWLPDLGEWARVVASMLRPGGRFFLREDHPFRATIGEDVSNGLRVEQAYLERAEPATWDEASTYIDTPEDGPAITHTVHHEWNHSLGEVVSALIGAGLVIDRLEEFATSAWAPWPSIMTETEAGYALRDRPERLPLEYVLQAHRPG